MKEKSASLRTPDPSFWIPLIRPHQSSEPRTFGFFDGVQTRRMDEAGARHSSVSVGVAELSL